MSVSVLLPTTGRPDRAESCVKRLLETTQGYDVQVVAAVDADGESAIRLNELGCQVDYSDELRGCSAAWNAALRWATGDNIVFAADDLEWGEGWLDQSLAVLEGNPGCMVGFNDGHWGEELSTHYLLPRSFIVEVLGGVVAWPVYKHSFNDLETCARARNAGRYSWCEDAHVYHSHWLFGDRAKDETDLRRLPLHAEDERIFKERQALGFPNDIDPVIDA